MARFSFLTPTWAGDYERFRLQRETMEHTGADAIPQVAVVHHEDLPLFEKVPFRRNLTLLSTRDVLPAWVEERRAGGRQLGPVFNPPGWVTQQLVKLAAPQAVPDAEAVVCLDSDVCFLKPVGEDDFFAPDGRLFLFEMVETFTKWPLGREWLRESGRFLGLPETPGGRRTLRNFIFMLVPLHRQVLLGLQEHVEARHATHWMEAFVSHGVTEYLTYGLYARYVNRGVPLAPLTPPSRLCLTFWPDTDGDLERNVFRGVQEHHPKAISIQSSIGKGVAEYRHLIST